MKITGTIVEYNRGTWTVDVDHPAKRLFISAWQVNPELRAKDKLAPGTQVTLSYTSTPSMGGWYIVEAK